MARLTLKLPAGSDVSAAGLGKNSPIPNPRGSLYAAYLHGTDFGDPSMDWSRNGRNLDPASATPSATRLDASSSAYAVMPFSSATLGAVHNELTMISIAKIDPAQGAILISSSVGAPSLTLCAPSANPVTAQNRDASVTATAGFGGVNSVVSCAVTSVGAGLLDVFPITFTGGGGSGAEAIGYAVGGVLQFIEVTKSGANYTSNPTPVLTAGGGSGATATASRGQDANRNSYYAMYAGVFTPTTALAYRKRSGRAAQTATGTKATGAFGSAGNLQAGYLAGATGLLGPVQLVFTALLTRGLSVSELDGVHAGMATLLARYGVTV